jgi:hypothetical protein
VAVPERNPQVIAQGTSEELVLLHLERGTYYSLDEVGSRIWELCDGTVTVEDIVTVLASEFDVSAATLRVDVAELLRSLSDEDLLTAP